MNEQQLSARLSAVSRWIKRGESFADIGSDHAYLPCYAVLKDDVPSAIAGEVVEGPFQSAQREVASHNLTGVIDVRLGSGLTVLQPGEVASVTICGMGGALIRDILEEGRDRLTGSERLILQPNIAGNLVRAWGVDNGYTIIGEEIIDENEKIYEIIVLEKRAEMPEYTAHDIQFGPFLKVERSEVWKRKWRSERDNRARIIEQIRSNTRKTDQTDKIHTLEAEIQSIEEVLRDE
ncbi:MAG: tRNA (adenine(22)-N(1))-methyltransferase [Bacilli bacterium]